MVGVEGNLERLLAPWLDSADLWLDLKGRVGGLCWLDGAEVELEGALLLVEAVVFVDGDLEGVLIGALKLSLVKDTPVDVESADARILNFENFADGSSVLNRGGHEHGGVHRVVVETNLVGWDHDGAARDGDAHWELNGGKAGD